MKEVIRWILECSVRNSIFFLCKDNWGIIDNMFLGIHRICRNVQNMFIIDLRFYSNDSVTLDRLRDTSQKKNIYAQFLFADALTLFSPKNSFKALIDRAPLASSSLRLIYEILVPGNCSRLVAIIWSPVHTTSTSPRW